MHLISPGETLIENKICSKCQSDFPITNRDVEMYDRISPSFNGKKYKIPLPTFCPDCRQQRRLSWRNERKLYRRKCDATGQESISMYHQESPFLSYDHKYWWTDAWDPLAYGRDFDFNRPFFEQFAELQLAVPRTGLILPGTNENTEYANDTADTKNSYMVVNGYIVENCYYSYAVSYGSADCMDVSMIVGSHNCYECIDSRNLYSCFYCIGCQDCSNIAFCREVLNCQDCFGCIGISHKRFAVFNTVYPEAEYRKKVAELTDLTRDEMYGLIKEKLKNHPRRNNNNIGCENSTGYDIKNSSDAIFSFWILDAKNFRYSWDGGWGENVTDSFMAGNTINQSGELVGVYRSPYSFAMMHCDETHHAQYCDTCYAGNSYLFWCIGLRGKNYCILNKQYAKEEYEVLVPQIIEHMQKTGEWGEFFPSSRSLFGYNETIANEYFPLDQQTALSQGFHWSDYEPQAPSVAKIIPAEKLPKDIEDIPDDILNWAIECEITGRPFRIIRQELDFYRKHHLPIPRRHPDQRHLDRLALRNPRKLFERKCDKCQALMITPYAPERPEIVYCSGCYDKEIIG